MEPDVGGRLKGKLSSRTPPSGFMLIGERVPSKNDTPISLGGVRPGLSHNQDEGKVKVRDSLNHEWVWMSALFFAMFWVGQFSARF